MFKQCPRCGGDVDASFSEDVRCVQCGDRPQVVYPGPIVLGEGGQRVGEEQDGSDAWASIGEVNGELLEAASVGSHGRVAVQSGAGPDLAAAAESEGAVAVGGLEEVCPRCGAGESMLLEKVRPEYNTCFRCRKCSHVYSP